MLKWFQKNNSCSWTTKEKHRDHKTFPAWQNSNSTCTNTDGWGNKLVTIFARHLDSLILTNNFSIIYQTRDFGSGQIQPLDNFLVRRDLQKLRHTLLAPWQLSGPPAGGYRGRDRMLRRVTFTPLNRRAVSTNGIKNWPLAVPWQISVDIDILCVLDRSAYAQPAPWQFCF